MTAVCEPVVATGWGQPVSMSTTTKPAIAAANPPSGSTSRLFSSRSFGLFQFTRLLPFFTWGWEADIFGILPSLVQDFLLQPLPLVQP